MHFLEQKLKGASIEQKGQKSSEPQTCFGVHVAIANSEHNSASSGNKLICSLSNNWHKNQLHSTGIVGIEFKL